MADEITLSTKLRLTAALRRKIRERRLLDREIETLSKQLDDLQKLGGTNEPVARASSIRRLSAEQAILERLRRAHPSEVTSSSLWLAAKSAGVASESTFRSHLHRMKAKGLISSENRGYWSIAPGVSTKPVVSKYTIKKLEDIDAWIIKEKIAYINDIKAKPSTK